MNLTFLKKERLKQNISQKKISTTLGYKYTSSYNKLETGTCNLTLETFIKICNILSLDLETAIKEVAKNV
ncbi:helix-turn-helix domain-containing protein [Clostridium ihumii]|uniref:helix-turn-helix domain-containing protein n=1 Tax=Clostridium ihumii TaxID=1470356 RepID=UPI00058C8A7E|nr:helix-turn-helix transcriptional regulator [Clostridium ihumii]